MPPALPAKPTKHVTARFYQTAAGTEPVRAWLKSLPLAERQAIGVDVRTTEYGWPIGMPTCKALGQGLWEIRTDLPNRIARVFFHLHGSEMILLHGIIKKTQKTPAADLATARARKDEFEERMRRAAAKKTP